MQRIQLAVYQANLFRAMRRMSSIALEESGSRGFGLDKTRVAQQGKNFQTYHSSSFSQPSIKEARVQSKQDPATPLKQIIPLKSAEEYKSVLRKFNQSRQ
ncbi:hypothetical protein GUITHDRAFT_156170 [Guillardia theta CCMP2712]|uniref:Uncharacterized protein n=2 Tax=Guillardia theta TaxID=55529 RepID=L1IAA1_GUITC|nr:hypothetical protein GUITHDRAFT_156170 [Guillardia theta CCMP2712]EKX33037.1 hypothetical protein GUITHDRAFT_156170 [Guillardia theta CCMP2712]|eukprot:XP_005820017.1 hypothetical protein GUITHDRAFT_156170 [Guillardia theta CCMP2712]